MDKKKEKTDIEVMESLVRLSKAKLLRQAKDILIDKARIERDLVNQKDVNQNNIDIISSLRGYRVDAEKIAAEEKAKRKEVEKLLGAEFDRRVGDEVIRMKALIKLGLEAGAKSSPGENTPVSLDDLDEFMRDGSLD